MSSVAIRAQGLAKRYRIGRKRERYRTIQQAIKDAAVGPFKRLGGVLRGESAVESDQTFWALKDVGFEVRRGDVVGVIGRNGAGKSTLLKVLSRITEPTSGIAEIHGRVGSLLEVGTGFHQELTGRENIFLNAAILGIRRADVRRDFDAIVSFAEVEKFVDTPVKHYSSGMYLRLAFAVAAFLEPEILLVDEVLAVGDTGFQKKCLGKMGEIARDGRTVFFVSHNLEAVRTLCSRGILMEGGMIQTDGSVEEALGDYAGLMRGPRSVSDVNLVDRMSRTSGAARVSEITAFDASGAETWKFRGGDTIRFRLVVEVFKTVPGLGFYLSLKSGITRGTITSFKHVLSDAALHAGDKLVITFEIPDAPLRPGAYAVYVMVGDTACETIFDVIDENVNLPWLDIWSDERDTHRREGYFSTPSQLAVGRLT